LEEDAFAKLYAEIRNCDHNLLIITGAKIVGFAEMTKCFVSRSGQEGADTKVFVETEVCGENYNGFAAVEH
jgi:hypothetical protein